MDDYQKLMRMMKYLHGTKSLPLTLKAHESGSINWWINGSFATWVG
jgi:hypothetical protein